MQTRNARNSSMTIQNPNKIYTEKENKYKDKTVILIEENSVYYCLSLKKKKEDF